MYRKSEGSGSRGGLFSSVSKRSANGASGVGKARGKFLTSDEDEVDEDDDEFDSIEGLLTNEDSEEDEEEEDDDKIDLIEKKASSSLGIDNKVSETLSPRTSSDQSESYLSEIRKNILIAVVMNIFVF